MMLVTFLLLKPVFAIIVAASTPLFVRLLISFNTWSVAVGPPVFFFVGGFFAGDLFVDTFVTLPFSLFSTAFIMLSTVFLRALMSLFRVWRSF